ncbi:MAG: hypothetical protein ABI234_05555 [Ktedonobacteraceae bacterium]
MLISGNGTFYQNSAGFWHTTYHWFFQSTWSADGSTSATIPQLAPTPSRARPRRSPLAGSMAIRALSGLIRL